MSSKYKFVDGEGIYFITSTVVGWVDVFTRNVYRDILLDSFRFCQQNQGLQIHAWVLMPNHFHMICSFKNEYPGMVLKNIKRFTALKLIDAIMNNQRKAAENGCLRSAKSLLAVKSPYFAVLCAVSLAPFDHPNFFTFWSRFA